MYVLIPELYKEYRGLKQAKENSSSDAASGHAEKSRSTAEVNTAQKLLKIIVFMTVVVSVLMLLCVNITVSEQNVILLHI